MSIPFDASLLKLLHQAADANKYGYRLLSTLDHGMVPITDTLLHNCYTLLFALFSKDPIVRQHTCWKKVKKTHSHVDFKLLTGQTMRMNYLKQGVYEPNQGQALIRIHKKTFSKKQMLELGFETQPSSDHDDDNNHEKNTSSSSTTITSPSTNTQYRKKRQYRANISQRQYRANIAHHQDEHDDYEVSIIYVAHLNTHYIHLINEFHFIETMVPYIQSRLYLKTLLSTLAPELKQDVMKGDLNVKQEMLTYFEKYFNKYHQQTSSSSSSTISSERLNVFHHLIHLCFDLDDGPMSVEETIDTLYNEFFKLEYKQMYILEGISCVMGYEKLRHRLIQHRKYLKKLHKQQLLETLDNTRIDQQSSNPSSSNTKDSIQSFLTLINEKLVASQQQNSASPNIDTKQQSPPQTPKNNSNITTASSDSSILVNIIDQLSMCHDDKQSIDQSSLLSTTSSSSLSDHQKTKKTNQLSSYCDEKSNLTHLTLKPDEYPSIDNFNHTKQNCVDFDERERLLLQQEIQQMVLAFQNPTSLSQT